MAKLETDSRKLSIESIYKKVKQYEIESITPRLEIQSLTDYEAIQRQIEEEQGE